MNIAHTASETTEVTANTTTKIVYVNMKLTSLATDINSGALVHKFNGKGRTITRIPESKEPLYVSYSSDQAGHVSMPQPFEINNGDRIKFKLQENPSEPSKATCKWKGIIQDCNDLQLVSGKTSTYKAVVTGGTTTETAEPSSETDDVIINISVKLNDEKFSVSWDPQVKIKKMI